VFRMMTAAGRLKLSILRKKKSSAPV